MSVVGIDLGTTNTVVGCVRSGKVHVLADEKGVRLLPSVVSFHPNGEVLVGAVAKARRIIDAKHTVYSHKRLIGRSWGSPEITQARSRFAFELREGPGQGPLVHARGQDYTLPEISAFVLKRARQIAETALGGTVERAVITVPAHFNELQRASTKVAGRVSGLEVLRILNEPTAAALAYGLGRSGNERVAVYDFGGGTFDCTLLDLNGNVFEVLATAGDSFLGGDDIDNLIADRMAEVFLKQHRQDARQDPQLFERLKTTAEEVKMALSTAETHTVVLKDFGHGPGGAGLNFQFSLSRKDLEALITPLVERSFKVTQDALALARLSPSSFDKVILVGGSTRVPLVRRRVEAFFGASPMDRVNPDEVVAIGAAIQAAALTEGIRRRSIPAPPGVNKRPSQNDTADNTETKELDPHLLKPAFGSEPPAFGFASASGSNPPDNSPAFASTVGSNPPGGGGSNAPNTAPAPPPAPTAPPNAAPPNQAGASAMATTMTSPTGPGSPARPAHTGVAAAIRQTKPGVAPATQPLGARPPAKGPARPNSDDAAFADLSPPTPFEWVPTRPQPAAKADDGFGAIDDPPSLVSTAASPAPPVRSGGAGAGGGAKAKIPPTREEEQFGAVPDLSLVSTTGVTSTAASDENPFGHVADLSLISSTGTGTSPATGLMAREPAPMSPVGPGNTVQLDPSANPAAKPVGRDALRGPSDDLPSVAAKAKPARHQPTPSGMTGKAPPLIAPQPFGPMERMDEPLQHTRAMPAAKPPPSPATQRGGYGPPLAQTSPMPAVAPVQAQSSYAGPPPQPMPARHPSAMPAPAPAPSPAPRAAASAPPPNYASAAPPMVNNPFSFGSTPPQAAQASQPPIWGSFGPPPPPAEASIPLDYEVNRAAADANTNPATQSMPGAAPGTAAPYQSPVLVDVTPRALVVETAGGYTDTIIPRNSKIPCERTRRFATGRDMQTSVRVRVGQGESPSFLQNTFLGEVELSGLRPAPRGDVTVAVTFEVDADGTLRVRARDVQTGQEARATLQLVGVADESSVVMMINRFAQQPVVGNNSN